jgi:hypothetical protein
MSSESGDQVFVGYECTRAVILVERVRVAYHQQDWIKAVREPNTKTDKEL